MFAQNNGQPVAANEPNHNSQAAAMSATEFDNNILGLTVRYLTPFNALINALHNIRVAAESQGSLQSQGIADWPKAYVYNSMDAILALYNMFLERGVFGAEYSAKLQASGNPDEIMERMLYDPSLLCALIPWFFTRTIYHVKPASAEEQEKLLESNTSIAAKMPQWSMCFNVADDNVLWDDRKVVGIVFARYFIAQAPADSPEALHTMQSPSVAGEERSVINNLISAVIFEDGQFDLGPFVALDDKETFKNFYSNLEKMVLEQGATLNNAASATEEQIREMASNSTVRAQTLLSYLIRALQNQDQFKDAQGNAAAIPANPSIVATANGLVLQPHSNITHLYLD